MKSLQRLATTGRIGLGHGVSLTWSWYGDQIDGPGRVCVDLWLSGRVWVGGGGRDCRCRNAPRAARRISEQVCGRLAGRLSLVAAQLYCEPHQEPRPTRRGRTIYPTSPPPSTRWPDDPEEERRHGPTVETWGGVR